ncbi:hypothetical protein Btru_075417 [Bulinus truncatus]|nr:hypothetical protein Btru_075417 [Bulinus truncatus]
MVVITIAEVCKDCKALLYCDGMRVFEDGKNTEVGRGCATTEVSEDCKVKPEVVIIEVCTIPEFNKDLIEVSILPENGDDSRLPEFDKGCNVVDSFIIEVYMEDSKMPVEMEGCTMTEEREGCTMAVEREGCTMLKEREGCTIPEEMEGCTTPDVMEG